MLVHWLLYFTPTFTDACKYFLLVIRKMKEEYIFNFAKGIFMSINRKIGNRNVALFVIKFSYLFPKILWQNQVVNPTITVNQLEM